MLKGHLANELVEGLGQLMFVGPQSKASSAAAPRRFELMKTAFSLKEDQRGTMCCISQRRSPQDPMPVQYQHLSNHRYALRQVAQPTCSDHGTGFKSSHQWLYLKREIQAHTMIDHMSILIIWENYFFSLLAHGQIANTVGFAQENIAESLGSLDWEKEEAAILLALKEGAMHNMVEIYASRGQRSRLRRSRHTKSTSDHCLRPACLGCPYSHQALR